jgi:poly(hydroxyalkanoate) granule-associated protein
MAEEVNQVVEEAAAQVDEASAEVKKAAKKAAKEVEGSPVAAAVKKATGSGKESVVEQVKGAAKGVQEGIEKSPVTAKAKQAVKDTAETVQKSPLLEAVHKVLLAGIGAAALAQEEIEDFINRLVERGEIAEADGKKMMKDVLEKRKQMVKKMPAMPAGQPKKISSDIEKRIEDVMAKLNIPTKDEIDALSAKITALTKKVDELKKAEKSG